MLADAPGAAKLKITAAKQERICMGQPGFASKRPSAPAYFYGQSGFCKPSLNGHVEGKAAMSAFGGEADIRDGMPLLTQSGHEWPAFAAMHGRDLLYLVHDPWPWGKAHEAGVHHTLGRRGGFAARSASAVAAARRRVHGRRCDGFVATSISDGIRAGAAAGRIVCGN